MKTERVGGVPYAVPENCVNKPVGIRHPSCQDAVARVPKLLMSPRNAFECILYNFIRISILPVVAAHICMQASLEAPLLRLNIFMLYNVAQPNLIHRNWANKILKHLYLLN